MTINEHTLIHAQDAGNGYHGRCEHCNAPLVTDLGYCSWDGLKCTDREIESTSDMPDDVLSYTRYNGMSWDFDKKKFVKSYADREYTLDEVVERIKSLLTT